ncbi:type I-E CRISPR-associated protein Cas5/CasD [Parasaccharibacter sp. TMW2.1882]|uniref:Type I-E CRISPR-associated protein Cas5/CasD n=1 Tax=Parasaccharibacter apium TaxID=1510841 RepID=A0ABX4ZK50_9PROT|nr:MULTISPECIES: type I-E CRISPR-associated protein Cas5/CasD [Parasaccharibacter]MCK8637626.1 type I-E CRISPR-associated protein Cas5/CasD [Parasaccharibacter sp. TMW2.1885]MCL1496971.1 type I-E CRISPR-associated protein Cas5/CasD [Parasaccharibacter sp. TMW2.1882]POS61192.1 type I-E CRISPR-associated protein Cas5/CasD [Parasaccharibacter apium]POS61810.1 type I-E CRISPR-associated protein Cas5/CasD [Parasaccharibacter apium]POS62555.1 type I-E CRISPR-associated protein Cas5/CasD [Parasacchar
MASPYLVFSLSASLGSMGELAGHERRGSLLWPGHSALIGLMGAALGIRRDGDFSGLDSLKIDVAVFDSGTALRDFHTIQSVPAAAVKKPNSRPEAIRKAGGRLTTSITLRDYRAGVFYGVAVQGEGLEEIAAALRKPHFTLYLGRKSCPLSSPLNPQVVQADTVEEALGQVKVPFWLSRHVDLSEKVMVVGEQGSQRDYVHDVPLDRQRWHFAARDVGIRHVELPGKTMK